MVTCPTSRRFVLASKTRYWFYENETSEITWSRKSLTWGVINGALLKNYIVLALVEGKVLIMEITTGKSVAVASPGWVGGGYVACDPIEQTDECALYLGYRDHINMLWAVDIPARRLRLLAGELTGSGGPIHRGRHWLFSTGTTIEISSAEKIWRPRAY